MSLLSRALRLNTVLKEIVRQLNALRDNERSRQIVERYIREIEPLVAAFDQAVVVGRDREAAKEILSDLKNKIRGLGVVCGHRNVQGLDFGLLDEFGDLSTIFQQSKYRHETLESVPLGAGGN